MPLFQHLLGSRSGEIAPAAGQKSVQPLSGNIRDQFHRDSSKFLFPVIKAGAAPAK
jgi:hypothetical protein